MDIITKLSAFEILFLTIVGEARSESIDNQAAIGCVIRNRMFANPDRYRSYKDVCLRPYQFPCWNNEGMKVKLLEIAQILIKGEIIKNPTLRQCMFVSRGIETWEINDNTHNSNHYLPKDIYYSPERPLWANGAKTMIEKGNHIFLHI